MTEQTPDMPEPKPRRPSIRDVARLAQVSPTVVSYVVNKSVRPVKEETRQRVLRAMDALGYRPDPSARLLRGKRSRTVAFLLPTPQLQGPPSPYWTALVSSALQAATTNRCTIVLASSEHIFTSFKPGSPLVDVPVAGAIITTPLVGVPVANFLARLPMPFVTIGRIGGQSSCYVDCDHADGIASIVRELHKMGHRRIAYLGGPPVSYAALFRADGFRGAMAELGMAVPPGTILESEFTAPSGEAAARRILNAQPRPTAVVCGNDESAIGLMRGLMRAGVQVPRDISVTGFDDIPLASAICPSLTTLRVPMREMADAAVHWLVAAMDGGDALAEPLRRVFPAPLMLRESVRTMDPPQA